MRAFKLPFAIGLPAFAELFCLTNFSFLQGASHAQELVARAKQLGYEALAITDECSLAGVVRAHAEAKAAELKLLIGSHFHLKNRDGSPALSLLWRMNKSLSKISYKLLILYDLIHHESTKIVSKRRICRSERLSLFE